MRIEKRDEYKICLMKSDTGSRGGVKSVGQGSHFMELSENFQTDTLQQRCPKIETGDLGRLDHRSKVDVGDE